MIHYSNCPNCSSGNISFYLSVKDHSVSGETFDIWQCKACSLKFTQDIPEPENIGRYYQSQDYISHTDTKEGLVNNLYHKVRSFTLGQKRKLVQSKSGMKTGKILDIGCGTGAFLNEMKDNGWNITGIEQDEATRQRAFQNYKISASTPSALFSLTQKFDAITMWHVLEHVHQLHDYIRECKRLLTDNGVLIIAVPNHTSGDAEHYKDSWAAWDVPRHLYHFSPESMKALMHLHGFKIEEMKPMWFDSFYVSMLSEKYSNKGNLPSAFVQGMVSNVKAAANVKKCSSVIYVLRIN
jgi:2-polyprenyl-3-methyl-5-hydroxy-6-metoxy-1,4-benzoquinol methylase